MHGCSIRQAAIDIGVHPTTWRDWEHGQLILFRDHRTRIAKLLDFDEQILADEMRARWNGKHRRWECRES